MGRSHAEILETIDQVELKAIADPHRPSLDNILHAIKRDLPAYADYAELLETEQLDAVIIATPNCTHADIACRALEAGLHVLLEKPMSNTIEGCNRLIEADRKTPKVFQIGLELRYTSVFQKLRQLIDEGRIGQVRQLWCKEFRGPWEQKVNQWITQQAASGGTLVEKDSHHFDLFNWFVASPPTTVAAFGSCDLVYGAEHFAGIQPDVLDNAQVIVHYDNGATAALMLCMYCMGCEHELELGVIGTEGWMVAKLGKTDVLELSPTGAGKCTTMEFDLPTEIRETSHSGAVYLEQQAFIENIRTGTQPLTDATAGWWTAAVGVAAERSVAERRMVEIAELPRLPAQ